MFLEVLLFLVGLVLLYFGAEFLVGGASALALRLGITPLIVGCTVVAFGTSAPELVVSIAAVTSENDAISVGNIIGSNIANLALIMGVAAMIRPIQVQSAVIFREYPVMALSAILFAFLAYDGELSRADGGILLLAMASYTIYMMFIARLEMKAGKDPDVLADLDEEAAEEPVFKSVLKVVFGMVGLAVGAKLMVDSAVSIATALNVDELLIGISIVAIGTSLPELATSVVAAVRDESDLSVGNVVGSNVFNTFLVLGVVASMGAITLSERVIEFDLWAMLGVTAIVWPIMFLNRRIGRIEGGILLTIYVSYMVYIFIR